MLKVLQIGSFHVESLQVGRTTELPVPVPDDSSYRHGCKYSGDADGSKTTEQVAENADESRVHG